MYIIVGSITTAMRLARLLEHTCGVAADVVHTPAAIKNGGCSYSVRVRRVSASRVRDVAAEYGVNVRGIYAEEFNGGERVWRALS